jgi:hypothetical protein
MNNVKEGRRREEKRRRELRRLTRKNKTKKQPKPAGRKSARLSDDMSEKEGSEHSLLKQQFVFITLNIDRLNFCEMDVEFCSFTR